MIELIGYTFLYSGTGSVLVYMYILILFMTIVFDLSTLCNRTSLIYLEEILIHAIGYGIIGNVINDIFVKKKTRLVGGWNEPPGVLYSK